MTFGDRGFRYRHLDTEILSDIVLPTLALSPDGDACEVRIGEGLGDLSWVSTARSGRQWVAGRRRVLFRLAEDVQVVAADGETIGYSCPDARRDMLAYFLVRFALPVLSLQRIQITVHASAVERDAEALLFCGQSGAGKSTIASFLGRHGYTMVADDNSALRCRSGEPPAIYPEGVYPRLDGNSTRALARHPEEAAQGDHGRRWKQDFTGVSLGGAMCRIRGIYRLRHGLPDDPPALRRLSGPSASRMVFENLHGLSYIQAMGMTEDFKRAARHIAEDIPCYDLTRPRDLRRLDHAIALLQG